MTLMGKRIYLATVSVLPGANFGYPKQTLPHGCRRKESSLSATASAELKSAQDLSQIMNCLSSQKFYMFLFIGFWGWTKIIKEKEIKIFYFLGNIRSDPRNLFQESRGLETGTCFFGKGVVRYLVPVRAHCAHFTLTTPPGALKGTMLSWILSSWSSRWSRCWPPSF